MERGLKRWPGEEQEYRQARATTEEQVDSITHVSFTGYWTPSGVLRKLI